METPVRNVRERWSSALAALLACFYLVTSILIAQRRLLWFDEIVTVLFGKLPSLGTIWSAAGRVDAWGMPAPYYFLVHGFMQVFGRAEVSARLPSILAMAAGLAITFDLTRRLTDGLHGLIALALLTCTFLPRYGVEARSYALYFMLSALSLWFWEHGRSRGARAGLIFFAIFFTGFMMHPYFILCLVPYTAGEIFRRTDRRHLHEILGGLAGVLTAGAILSAHILAAGTSRTPFPGQHPSLPGLINASNDVFPGALLILMLTIVWIALAGPAGEGTTAGMSSAERVGWFFLLILMVGFFLAEAVTKAFDSRYFIGMLPGASAAFAMLLWRNFRQKRLVGAGILVLFVSTGLAEQTTLVRHPELIDPYGQQTETRQVLRLEATLTQEGKQYIVITGTLLYMQAQYYAQHPERFRFLVRDDPTYRLPLRFAEYYPLKVWQLKDLRDHAAETALIFSDPAILGFMKDAGHEPTLRFEQPMRVAYFK